MLNRHGHLLDQSCILDGPQLMPKRWAVGSADTAKKEIETDKMRSEVKPCDVVILVAPKYSQLTFGSACRTPAHGQYRCEQAALQLEALQRRP